MTKAQQQQRLNKERKALHKARIRMLRETATVQRRYDKARMRYIKALWAAQ